MSPSPGTASPTDEQESPRAWAMAWALGWTELISWGILYYAFSVLLVPMQEALGWSAGVLTGAYSLSLLASGVVAPWVGRWIDRHGGREVMTAASVLGALMMLAWSRVESVPMFYLIWIGIGIAMAGILYDPAFATIAPWFEDKRGRAMLIITFLGGLASTVFFPLTGWLEVQFDWRNTLLILALFLAVTTILPHALVLRTPRHVGEGGHLHRPSTSRALLTNSWFMRLSFVFFLQMFTIAGVSVHLVAYLLEKGLSPTSAAWIAGTIGIAQTVARVLVTVFENVFEPEHVTIAMFVLQAIAVLILVIAPAGAAIYLAVLALGFGRGAFTLLRPAILLKHYRVEEFGAVNGTMAAILTVAGALAPVSAGVAVELLGNYNWVFGMYGVIFVAGAWILWIVRSMPIPQHEHVE